MTDFPVDKISLLAEKESWRKEINRPIYHLHKWWAQRLGSVFRAILIYVLDDDKRNVWNNFYKKRDYSKSIVLDPFMGSGTTIGEALKLRARAIGCDINPISSFLVQQEFTHVSLDELYSAYLQIEKKVSNRILHFYQTKDAVTGEKRQVLYYFWVKFVVTPFGEEIPLFSRYVFAQNAYPSKKPSAQIICPRCWEVFSGLYNETESICPHCGYFFNPQKGPANNTTVSDSKGRVYRIKSLIPPKGLLREKMYASLSIDKKGQKKYQKITEYDLELYHEACMEYKSSKLPIPYYEIEDGFNTSQARGYNYLYWKDFFNKRQLLCLGLLLNAILDLKNHIIQEQFLCLFSSTLEFNNMFCSYKGEGTGAVRPIFSNHILKPERTPLENSVWGHALSSGCFSTLYKTRFLRAKEYLDSPFEIKINSDLKTTKILASDSLNPSIYSHWKSFESASQGALILNGDSSVLPIPNGVVDCVITDPPFFDFIHYSELSDFFYSWISPVLKDRYSFFSPTSSRRSNEVQNKDAKIFSDLLSDVFKECYRVLKHNGKLVFSFHHSTIQGWIAIIQALIESDYFILEVFPVHAELMASTTKNAAKEPISIDAIIIASKEHNNDSQDGVIARISYYIKTFRQIGKRLSQTDVFVIAVSQSLKYIINNRFSELEANFFIDSIMNRINNALNDFS